jgi:hypothetical protein
MELIISLFLFPFLPFTLVFLSPLSLSLRVKVKGKGKVVSVFNKAPRREGVCGSGGIAPRINFGARWRWVVSFTPRPLHSRGKKPR